MREMAAKEHSKKVDWTLESRQHDYWHLIKGRKHKM